MGRNTPAWIGLGLLVLAGIALVFTHGSKLPGGIAHDSFARIVTGVALLIFIGGGVAVSYAGRVGLLFKQAISWLGIGLALVVVYSFKPELVTVAERTMGALMPGRPMNQPVRKADARPSSHGVVAITGRRDGHFEADAMVNGASVRFLIDTGATAVILTPDDARRAGININMLKYTAPVNTANGRVFQAPVRLDDVRVGSIQLHDVRALVGKPGQLGVSLLGMSFLKRLRSFKIGGDQLVLEQ